MGEGETSGADVPGEEPTPPSEPYDSDPRAYEPEPDQPGSLEGAPDDEELPLTAHIEEMFSRLLRVLVVMAVVSGIVFPFSEWLINFLWYSYIGPASADVCTQAADVAQSSACPRVYHPLGLILARLKVATLAGFVAALPVLVYESYLFMRPGLYPHERRYYLASVPTSLLLAFVGLLFAHIIVLPAIFTYFLFYSEGAAEIAFSLGQTFELMVLMLGFFAFVFQIPLFIMLAIMMGVTSRRWLADKRLYFWAGFATVAFIFNPDPTGMAPFIVTATMIVLFEGTLALLYWTGDGSLAPTLENATAARPYVWGTTALVGYLLSSFPMPGSYFGAIPASVFDALDSIGVLGYLPVLVALAIVGLFEGTLFALKRRATRRSFRAYLRLRSVRIPVLLGAIALGYFANPDPPLVSEAESIALPTVEVAAIVVSVIGLYELGLAIWRWRRPDRRS
ncbi:twin-arginine translocase subunit TatC [Halapricum desulfuricans]|uniref:Sec-independent protein translocase protein TatC n=1 Tax=Halapricum desulfuricans TaxID=2841257 RepID=A0A897MZK1_9EURY|nr:twin-arginine translocase subunit TatC [Halapricum desulfuricans]QSG07510.1 Archaellum protein D/E [Halapricum desulfuricans]